jgi:hypothetical protein
MTINEHDLFPIIRITKATKCFTCSRRLNVGMEAIATIGTAFTIKYMAERCITCHEYVMLFPERFANGHFKDMLKSLRVKGDDKVMQDILSVPPRNKAFLGSPLPRKAKSVISILTQMGGINEHEWTGADAGGVYLINPEDRIIKCRAAKLVSSDYLIINTQKLEI